MPNDFVSAQVKLIEAVSMIKKLRSYHSFCISSDNIVIHSGFANAELMFDIIYYIIRTFVCQEALEHLFEIIIPAVCSCGEGYIMMKLYLIKEDVYIEKLCLIILTVNIGNNSGGLSSE